MRLKKIVKLYEKHAVSVSGMTGAGKDMLTANVIERRGLPHVTNCHYNSLSMPYDYNAIDCGGNTYRNFIDGDVNFYEFPYFDGCDIYLSDCGIYFPSQYCNELNKAYSNLPTFVALARQLGKSHVHFNSQNVGRVWDKIREMSDVYIYCNWCKVLPFGIVIQKITIYDKYQSCADRVKPCRIRKPLICSSERRTQIKMYLDNYHNTHGEVRSAFLIYRNKSKYDTRFFKTMLKGGKRIEREEKPHKM